MFAHNSGAASLHKWIVVAVGAAAMMFGFGAFTTVTNFMKPLEAEFGWARADISSAYTFASIGAALGGLFFGHMADRFDTRAMAVFGALVMGTGLVLLAHQQDLGSFRLIYLLIGALGFGPLYTPVLSAVGLWFERGRGLAVGVVTAGGTLGQGIMPPLVQHLLEHVHWRDAFTILGIGYLVTLAPLMFWMTKPPTASGATGSTAAPGHWNISPVLGVGALTLIALLCCSTMAVPLVHLLPQLVEAGHMATTGANLMLILMLSGSIGRIVFGLVADHVGALRTYALASATQTLSVYWFVELASLPSLYVLAIVFGFGFSGVMTALILCVREAAPARATGLATAIVGLSAWLGMGVGGYAGGYCFDVTGAYQASFAGAALAGAANLTVVAALALLIGARRRDRARRQAHACAHASLAQPARA